MKKDIPNANEFSVSPALEYVVSAQSYRRSRCAYNEECLINEPIKKGTS